MKSDGAIEGNIEIAKIVATVIRDVKKSESQKLTAEQKARVRDAVKSRFGETNYYRSKVEDVLTSYVEMRVNDRSFKPKVNYENFVSSKKVNDTTLEKLLASTLKLCEEQYSSQKLKKNQEDQSPTTKVKGPFSRLCKWFGKKSAAVDK